MLLNDRYDPDWKVFVDGKPDKLLRCNYVMRGVALAFGEHTVEFRFEPKFGSAYVSLAAIIMGLGLLGLVVILDRRAPSAEPAKLNDHPMKSLVSDKKSKA